MPTTTAQELTPPFTSTAVSRTTRHNAPEPETPPSFPITAIDQAINSSTRLDIDEPMGLTDHDTSFASGEVEGGNILSPLVDVEGTSGYGEGEEIGEWKQGWGRDGNGQWNGDFLNLDGKGSSTDGDLHNHDLSPDIPIATIETLDEESCTTTAQAQELELETLRHQNLTLHLQNKILSLDNARLKEDNERLFHSWLDPELCPICTGNRHKIRDIEEKRWRRAGMRRLKRW